MARTRCYLPSMDRDRIRAWLDAGHRTFRWSTQSREGYEAVETRDEGLRWYRWSHQVGGGEHDVLLQSFQDFVDGGPARPAPQRVISALEAWVQARPSGACEPSAPRDG